MGIIDYLKKHPLLDGCISFFVGFLCLLNRVIFTGNFRNKKNILVVSLHRIGDTVFTIPAIKYLYSMHGKNLIIACFPESAEIYKLVFENLSYIDIPRSELKLNGRLASSKIRKAIYEVKAAAIFDITGSINSISMLACLPVGKIYGIASDYYKYFYTDFVIQRTTPHLIDLYFDIVNHIYPEADVKLYREFNANTQASRKILIHPFAGWKAKEWNFEKIVKLAAELSENFDVSVICEKGRVNGREKDIVNYIKNDLIETSDFNDLLKNINKSALFIGNDSGPLYIAALMGKPTFCIYSSTNPAFSFPFGKNHRYIFKTLPCSAAFEDKLCSKRGGETGCDVFECLNQLNYEEVSQKIKDFIKDLNIEQKFS